MTRLRVMRCSAGLSALAAGVLAGAPAGADPLPLHVDYQAAQGCPGADVFVDEIRWRTALARIAAPGEEALGVQARLTRRGENHHGRLVLGSGPSRVVREIDGEVCDEVVSALALITALAVDPRASLGRRPPAPPPAPPAPPTPPAPFSPPELEPASPPASLPPPDPIGPPLPALLLPDELPAPSSSETAPFWTLAASAWTDVGIAPQPLFGGGITAARHWSGRWAPSLHLAVEAGGTGTFDAGTGGASFVKAAGRVAGCAFAWRPVAWFSLVPCVAAEGGILHAEATSTGTITHVTPVTVPWAALGALPRIGLGVGRWFLEIEGGPVVPLVRRSFVFTSPSYVVSDLPPVIAHVGLGVGVTFP